MQTRKSFKKSTAPSTPKIAAVSFNRDNTLIVQVPENSAFQREAVQLLQGAGFDVFADSATRERLASSATDKRLFLTPVKQ